MTVGSAAGPGELSRALEPLYRNYLRRLAEMAARIDPKVLLRESTTRDDAGRLVLGDDGFPLRFDMADSNTGSTFEVRSGKFDEPSAASARVGALEVQLVSGCWEELVLSCSFDGEPVPEDATAVADLIRAFAELAQHGAFSPRGAAEPWSGRLHSIAIELRGETVIAVLDLGTCPPQALETLFCALDGFGRDRAPLARVRLGGPRPSPA